MADARYVIDLIINARDNTAEAFASALNSSKALARIQEEQKRKNEELTRSYKEMTGELRTSQLALKRQMNELSLGSVEAAQDMVKLEKATKNYVRQVDEHGKKSAQAVVALHELRKAEDELTASLKAAGNEQSRIAAEQLVNNVKQIEMVGREAEAYQKAAKAKSDADRALAREREEQLRRGAQVSKEIEDEDAALYKARIQGKIDQLDRLKKAEEDHNNVQQALADQEQARADEEEARRQANFASRQAQREREVAAEKRRAETLVLLQEGLSKAEKEDRDRALKERERQEKQGAAMSKAIEDENLAIHQARVQTKIDRNKAEADAADKYLDKIRQISNLEKQRLDAVKEKDQVTAVRLEVQQVEARAEAEVLARHLRNLFDDIPIDFDVEAKDAEAHMVRLYRMKEALDGKAKIEVDVDAAAAIAQMLAVRQAAADTNKEMGFLGGLMQTLRESFHKSSSSVSGFDNYLRGLLSLGMALFFNQLILLAGAAASAFLALASSAAFAGAAIGGALTAGIAQAVPVVGILVAALSRVKSVFDAVKQANLLQEQQSYQGEKADRQRANSIDNVRNAEEGLADANRRVADAQKEVNEAREEAANKLRDLILQERGLSLTMEETQEAIQKAIREGDVSALPRLALQADATRADLGDVRQEIGERREAGPEGAPEVVQAKEALADAERAARRAARGLEQAKRSADEAAEGVTAAAGKLNYLLGQLSDAERKLYDAVVRLQKVWRKFAQEATEPLIIAFTGAVNKITDLLLDPKIRAAAKSMAEGLATQFTRIFEAFTSNEAIDQMLQIVKQAQENLKPLGTIAVNIGKAFLDIAEAAGPALKEIIEWAADISIEIRKFFEAGRDKGTLEKFFKDGVTHLKAWGDLLWSIGRLFLAIAGDGGGAKAGLKMVQDMAEGIGKWADEIEKPGTKLNEFFNRFFELGRKMLDAIGPVFTALADEFDKTFTGDGVDAVEGFATFLADVLIPALGTTARFLGRITTEVGEFLDEHPQVAKMAAAFIAMLVGAKVLGGVFSLLRPLVSVIGFIGGRVFALGKHLDDVGKKLGGFGGQPVGKLRTLFTILRGALLGTAGAATLIVGVLVGLVAISGKLDDVWRKIVDVGKRVWKEIQPGIDEFRESLEDLIDTFQEGGGLISVLKAVGSFIADVLMSVIDGLGDVLAGAFNGAARILGGVMDLLNALLNLFQGDLDEAWRLLGDGLKNIGRGIFDIIWGIIKGIGGIFGDIFTSDRLKTVWDALYGLSEKLIDFIRGLGSDVADGFVQGLKDLAGLILSPFKTAWDAVLGFFGVSSPSTLAADLGNWIIEGLINGIKAAAGLVADAAGAVWDVIEKEFRKQIRGLVVVGRLVYNAIRTGLRAAAGLIKTVASAIWNPIEDAIRAYIRTWVGFARWVVNAANKAVNAASDLLRSIGKTVWDFIVGAIKGYIGAWKWLGTWIYNAAKDAVEAVADKFKDIGKAVITGISEGIKAAPGLILDAINWVLDNTGVLGKVARKGMEILGSLNPFQEGGPVPGGYGGGDRIPAMLEPGEHVWTKEEVQAAGGQSVMFALRALLGGGGQATGLGMAVGGDPFGLFDAPLGPLTPRTPTARKPSRAEKQKEEDERKRDLSKEREDYKKSGEERARDWATMWNDMETTARRASNDIEKQVRDLRVNTTASFRRMRRDWDKVMSDIVDNFDRQVTFIVDMWAKMFEDLGTITYEGLNYIGHETNKALVALGAEHINFGLAKPKKSDTGGTTTTAGGKTQQAAATGGMIGYAGERGRDGVHTVLGRGEAVLNYAQQKYVDPAVQYFYGHGLQDTFKRVRGYHAGGYGTPGLATGGALPNVMGSKPGFAVLMRYFMRKFDPRLTVSSGKRAAGAFVAGTTRVSNHGSGDAIDIQSPESIGHTESNPPPINALDKLHPFLLKWPQPPRRDLVWRSTAGGNHYNHVHLGMDPSVTATLDAARNFLKGFPGGGDFATSVGRVIVEGIKPLGDIVQKALDKVRKAANEKIDDELGDMGGMAGPGGQVKLGAGPAAKKIFDFFVGHGLSPEIAAGFVGTFDKESGFSTTVLNQAGSGAIGLAQWLGGRKTALMARENWQSLQTQLDFVWEELHGAESAAFEAIKRAKSPAEAARIIDGMYERSDRILNAPELAEKWYDRLAGPDQLATGGIVGEGDFGGEFASGGQVPGGRGKRIPIIAHAGEWILNPRQQDKVATMLGTTVGKLRDYMGFTGGPESFENGGVPTATMTPQPRARRRGDLDLRDVKEFDEIYKELDALAKALDAITKKKFPDKVKRAAKKLDVFTKNIVELTEDGGTLELMTDAIEAMSTRLQRRIDLAQVGFKRVGSKLAKMNPLVDAVKIADRAVDMYHDLYVGLREQRKIIDENLEDVNKKIKSIQSKKGGLTKEDKKADSPYNKLLAARNDLLKEADESDEAIAKNRADIFEKMQERFAAETEKALRSSVKAGERADLKGRLAGIFGREDVVRSAGLDQLDALNAQQTELTKRRDEAKKKLGSGKKKDPRWQAVVDDLNKQLNDLSGTIADQVHNNNVAVVEAINNDASRAEAGVNIQRRIQTVLGNEEQLPSLADQSINIMANQQAKLRAELTRLASVQGAHRDEGQIRAVQEQIDELDASITEATVQKASDAIAAINTRFERSRSINDIKRRVASVLGRTDEVNQAAVDNVTSINAQIAELQGTLGGLPPGLRREVEQQIRELQASVVEATAQMRADAIAEIEKQAARRETARGLRGRLADLQERTGGRLAAIQARQGITAERVTDLTGQRASLATQRFLAALEGNQGVVEELDEKIAALDVTIQEETQTSKDLVFVYRQAVTEMIAARTTRTTGLIDTASSIIQKVGAALGAVDFQAIEALVRQAGETLRGAGTQIAENVRAAIGEMGGAGGGILGTLVNAFQKGPREFATAMAALAPAIAALEETMSEAERTAFQALIAAMSDNTLAVLDNNDQLNQITGRNAAQGFASSMWQIFRQPIFSGGGSLLPQFNFPQMQSGGYVHNTGLYRLHAGERVLNPAETRTAATSGVQQNLYITNPTEVADPDYIFSVAEFHRSNRRAT